jgi:carotenoid cleavage dioxygenase
MSLSRRQFLHQATLTGTLLTLHPGSSVHAKEKSPFLQGNFAPVREEVTHEKLQVIGAIPKEIHGMFLRNGPNPQFDPIGGYHWFDGDAMLHGVHFREGKASYRNRYIRTAGWEEERKAGKALYGGLMDPPDLSKMLTGNWKKLYKNVANTNLILHHQKLLALWEGGDPYELKFPSLETVKAYDFAGKLKHPWSAHPKIDIDTGEMIGFGYMPVKPYCSWSVVDSSGKLVRTQPVRLPRPVMMHDFAITKNYAIFPDLPQTFDFSRLLKGEPMMKFEPNLGARFGLVPRTDSKGKTLWFSVEPGFVFHILNAYEEADEVVLIACRYSRFPDELSTGVNDKPMEPNLPRLHEWRFNLKTSKTTEKPLDDIPTEFPRINETLTGRKTRFGYAGRADGDMFTAFRKYDLEKGTITEHSFGKGRFGGEGIFVPRPSPKSEDDGFLMTFIFDKAEEKSELVIADAQDLSTKPLARVLIPTRVPYGFHATWLAGG